MYVDQCGVRCGDESTCDRIFGIFVIPVSLGGEGRCATVPVHQPHHLCTQCYISLQNDQSYLLCFILTAITTVLTVPRGSWNILIEEVSPSNNTLSMQAKITVHLQNSHGFNWPFFSALFQSSVTTTLMEMRIPIWALISMLGWAGLGGIITRTPERVKC